MNRRAVIIGLAVTAGAIGVAALALSRGSSASSVDRSAPGLDVVVTVPPLAELARRLAPAGSRLTVLMPPGRSEHGHEFTPTDLAALSRADVVVYVGLGLEPQVEKFVNQNPSDRRRDVCFSAAAGIHATDHDAHEHDEHAHDDHGHDHGAADPHLWLDPVLVRKLVPVLAGAMGAAMKACGEETPAAVQALVEAEETLNSEIDAVDGEYRRALAPYQGAAIVTHHNAWGRLAERYGLEVAAVLRPIETAEPTPDQVADAVAAIKNRGASTIFVEPQFDAAPARRLAQAAGAKVLVLDPLGEGQWFALMRENLASLVDGLSRQPLPRPR